MKKIKPLLVFAGIFVYTYCFPQQVHFTINGHLQNKSTSEKLFLQNGEINEEVSLNNNKAFTYTGILDNPGWLLIKTENSYAWGIWVNNGQIDVTLEEYYGEVMDSTGKKLLKITAISGPPETEKNQWFIDYRNTLATKYHAVPQSQRNDSIVSYYYPALEEYVFNHPASKLSAYLIQMSGLDADRRSKLLALLNREMNVEEAQRIKKSIERENLLTPGNTIASFQQQQLDGKLFSLNILSDPYVLLEFWSSDCIPCQAANPALVNVYNQYHNKGFEIVGISLDHSKKAWKKAVKKDKLPWIHISDLKGWNNAIASKYLIDEIPFNILIDKNHKIIGTNLTGKNLSDKLNEIIDAEGSR